MFSYIKWEFKSIFKSNRTWFSTIAIIFLLEFLFIKMNLLENTLGGLLTIAYLIILMITLCGAFIYGTKRTLDTFSKPTFLLESMIPIPASKLLLAKYLIAIIMNIFYTFVFIFGIFIMVAAVEESLLIKLLGEWGKLILNDPINLLRSFFSIICTSTAFTSIITTIFCFFKSRFPNGKALNILSAVLGFFVIGLVTGLFLDMLEGVEVGSSLDLITDGFMLLLIIVGYVSTVHLIENKLEIYG